MASKYTMRPAATMHALAGSPPQDRCTDLDGARCRLCGGTAARGTDFDRWQGSSFTSQDRVRDWSSPWICEPCVWACSWVAPPDKPPNPDGKKGLNLRLFSHLWSAQDGYRSLNKANKPEILAWLRARRIGDPWWAAIADSGQKHVLPWTAVNLDARGVIRFEEADVAVGDWALVDDAIALLTAGASKAEVEAGEYGVRTWMRCRDAIDAFEQTWRGERGSDWFGLSLWLAQRGDQDGRGRAEGVVSRADAGRDPCGARAVSRGRSKRVDALGSDHEPIEGGAADASDGGGVGERAREDAAPRGAEQLSLLGDDHVGG